MCLQISARSLHTLRGQACVDSRIPFRRSRTADVNPGKCECRIIFNLPEKCSYRIGGLPVVGKSDPYLRYIDRIVYGIAMSRGRGIRSTPPINMLRISRLTAEKKILNLCMKCESFLRNLFEHKINTFSTNKQIKLYKNFNHSNVQLKPSDCFRF